MQSDIFDHDERAKEAKDRVKDQVKQLREAYRSTFFDSPNGWKVLLSLLEVCHVHSSTFTGNSTGMFKEGERNIGLHILGTLGLNSPEGSMLLSVRYLANNPETAAEFRKELGKIFNQIGGSNE